MKSVIRQLGNYIFSSFLTYYHFNKFKMMYSTMYIIDMLRGPVYMLIYTIVFSMLFYIYKILSDNSLLYIVPFLTVILLIYQVSNMARNIHSSFLPLVGSILNLRTSIYKLTTLLIVMDIAMIFLIEVVVHKFIL